MAGLRKDSRCSKKSTWTHRPERPKTREPIDTAPVPWVALSLSQWPDVQVSDPASASFGPRSRRAAALRCGPAAIGPSLIQHHARHHEAWHSATGPMTPLYICHQQSCDQHLDSGTGRDKIVKTASSAHDALTFPQSISSMVCEAHERPVNQSINQSINQPLNANSVTLLLLS